VQEDEEKEYDYNQPTIARRFHGAPLFSGIEDDRVIL
jgi:hypothetical protein